MSQGLYDNNIKNNNMTATRREFIPTKYPRLEIEEILAASGLYTIEFAKSILDLSENNEAFQSLLLGQGFIEEDGQLTEFATKNKFFVDYGLFRQSGEIESDWLVTDRGMEVLVAYAKSQKEYYSSTSNLYDGSRR
jgi:hypothetical protein